MEPLNTFDFTLAGREFTARIYADDVGGAPWERADGHGPVRYLGDREPLRRGEVVLADKWRGRYVYDFGAALVQARKERWGLAPEDLRKLGEKPSKSRIRAAAVRADMARLRGWCLDDWCYVGVSVTLRDHDDDYAYAIWGVESDCDDYLRETAAELAGELLRGEQARAYPVNTVGV